MPYLPSSVVSMCWTMPSMKLVNQFRLRRQLL